MDVNKKIFVSDYDQTFYLNDEDIEQMRTLCIKKAGAHLLPLCMLKQKTYIKSRKILLPLLILYTISI